MWPVSTRFLTTVAQNHRTVATATITVPGGDPQPLTLSVGSVTTDRTQRIRRTADLTVAGGSVVFELVSTPGAQVAVTHGFLWGGTDQELVPMIVGELASAAMPLQDGTIRLSVADLWQRVAASDYLTPFTPDMSATRVAVVTAALLDACPAVTVVNDCSDTGTVATVQAWTSRSDMIASLATDGGFDAYFLPNGTFLLADTPTVDSPVAWLIKTGDGGTLSALTRTRPLSQVYNTVVVEPATTDAAQDWDQVIAQITDPTSPLHPANIGVRPYRYQSPTALTADDAQSVAAQLLFKMQGSTETLALDAVSNPALEAGDVIRILTPLDGGSTIVTHFLDSFEVDLATGGMSCATRVTGAAITADQAPVAQFTAVFRSDGRTVDVDASPSYDPDGTISSYAWTFGDGGTATSMTATNSYTGNGAFTIGLTVTDAQGVTGTAFQQVQVPVSGSPTADFTAVPRSGSPLVVDFDAIASVPSGTITAYDWNFTQSTYHSTSPKAHGYVYNAAGTYTVTLTVTASSGATATASKQVVVSSSTTPTNQPPSASISSVNLQSDQVTVKPVGAYSDPNGYVAQAVWDWGDDSTATTLTGTSSTPPATTTTHTYTTSGTFTITLTATDDGGASTSTTATVTTTVSTGYTNDSGLGTNNGQQVTSGSVTLFSASGSDFGSQATNAGSGKQLSLPVGSIQKLKGLSSSVIHAADITAGGGVIGAGSSKSIVSQVANSSTGASVQSGTTSSELIRVTAANVVLQDFQILGTTQSVKVMHGLDIRAANPTVRRVKLIGAGPGNDKTPPGETFGLSYNSSSGGLVEDVEIDGNGLGASNFGTNSWTGPLTINRLYSHSNPYSGGIALWQTKGGVTLNDCTFDGCRCFWNIERCSDTVTLNRPRIGTLKAATSGWAGSAATTVGIFCESDATWGTSVSTAFRFVVNDPRNLDGSVYSGPKITVNFGSKGADGSTNLYGRTNFKAYNAAGTDISSSFYTYGGTPYN